MVISPSFPHPCLSNEEVEKVLNSEVLSVQKKRKDETQDKNEALRKQSMELAKEKRKKRKSEETPKQKEDRLRKDKDFQREKRQRRKSQDGSPSLSPEEINDFADEGNETAKEPPKKKRTAAEVQRDSRARRNLAETPEQTRARLDKEAQQKALSRSKLTDEEKTKKKADEALRRRELRASVPVDFLEYTSDASVALLYHCAIRAGYNGISSYINFFYLIFSNCIKQMRRTRLNRSLIKRYRIGSKALIPNTTIKAQSSAAPRVASELLQAVIFRYSKER